MKKVLYSLTAFAVFAVLALPAGAGSHKGGFGGFSYDSSIEVTNTNVAMGVGNSSNTSANTGGNDIEDNTGDVKLKTGDAAAVSMNTNLVNSNKTVIFDDCGCVPFLGYGRGVKKVKTDSSIEVTNKNMAMGIGNSSNTSANTGDNEVEDNGGIYHYQESLDKYSKSKSHNYDWWHGWYGSKTYKKSHSHWQMSETYPAGGDVKVKTGDATAYSDNVNVVNTNETLIVRGGLMPN